MAEPPNAMLNLPSPEQRIGRSARSWIIFLSGVSILAVVGIVAANLRHKPELTDKDTIVLADFINKTGDPVFDETLRQGLEVQLEQSPFLSLISQERIRKALRLMDQSEDAKLTPQLARELCERTASAAVLEGSIASLGSQYVLGLRAWNCRNGDVLDDEQVQASRKEDVLNALSQIATRFRTRAGESLTTIKEHDAPLFEVTTPSLEALKVYSAAKRILSSTGSVSALPLFKRATEIDPGFAMAHAHLGRVYADIGESVLSNESTSKAWQLRNRASDRERFYITASYELQVTGNLEKAQQICELWAQTYPRDINPDVNPHGFLGAMIYPVFGEYEKAVEESTKFVAMSPDFAIAYEVLAYSYEELDRFGEAEKTIQGASERKLEIPDFLTERYDIAFLKNDKAEMERQVALAHGKSGAEDWISDHEGFVLAYSGRLREAVRKYSVGRIWPSRRVSVKGQLCGQPDRHSGKAFSEMRLRQRGARRQRLRSPRAAMWSMVRPLHWPSRGIPRNLKHWRMIWKRAFRRIRRSGSVTCQRFAHVSR